jgi:hypothetical protein
MFIDFHVIAINRAKKEEDHSWFFVDETRKTAFKEFERGIVS